MMFKNTILFSRNYLKNERAKSVPRLILNLKNRLAKRLSKFPM